MRYNRLLYILLVLILTSICSFAQNKPDSNTGSISISDTTMANEYFIKAEKLHEEAQYDSSNFYLENASVIFRRIADYYGIQLMWQKTVKCYHSISDNLIQKGEYENALKYLNKALEIGLNIFSKNSPVVAESYNSFGEVYRENGEYTRALEFYDKALTIWLKVLGNEHPTIAICYNNIGSVYAVKNDNDQALEYFNKSLMVRLQVLGENHSDVAESYNNIAYVYGNRGNYNKAIEYYEKSSTIFLKALGEINPNVAACYNGIGSNYIKKGDYDRGIEYFNKSLEIMLQVIGNKHPNVALLYNNIAYAYSEKGDHDQAFKFYEVSSIILLEIFGENHPYVAFNYNNIGQEYCDKGDYDQALKFFHKSLAIGLQVWGEKHLSVATGYNNIGNVYILKKIYDQALKYHKKSLSIRLQVIGEKHPDVSLSYQNLGEIYRRTNKYDQALKFYHKSLAISLQMLGEIHPKVATSYLSIGMLYLEKEDYVQALEYFNRSFTIRLKVWDEKHPDVAETYRAHGKLQSKQNNLEKALYYYQKSISSLVTDFSKSNIYVNPPLANIISEISLLTSLEFKADALQQLFNQTFYSKQLYLALSTYQLAVDLIDQIRSSYKTEGSKLFLGEKTAKIYNKALQTALQVYEITQDDQYKEQAFTFAEKSKAAVLSASLNESKAKLFAGIPATLLERERELKIDLTFYDTQLQKEREKREDQDSLKIRDFEDRFFTLNREYEALIEKLEKEYPEYYRLKYQTQTISVPELQKNITDNAVLLQYFVGDSTLHIFTVSKDQFDVTNLPIDSTTFRETIDTFYLSIKTDQKENFIKSAYTLYNQLVAPVADKINSKEQLIFIPHRTLYKIPFEALLTQLPEKSTWDFLRGDRTAYQRLDYLVKKFTVSYHYSATLYANMLQEPPVSFPSDGEELVAFAPVFRTGKPESKMVATDWYEHYWESVKELFSGILRDGENFNELVFSEGEVQGITSAFEKQKITAQKFLYADASEMNFKNHAGEFKYVHLATHSFANEEKPALSGIAFSQLNDTTDTEDDILYSGETFNLKLNADLLVLSSCESGFGKLVQGEGMMALTRGFLYSGAKNIIYSLWNVYDQKTSQLMVDFYRQMLDGKSYSEALRAAKLNMIKHADTAAPIFWSGFLLLGE